MSPLGSKITIRPRGMGVVDGTATVHVEVKFEGPIALKLLTVGRGRQRRTPAPLLGGAATTASRATPSS